MIPLVADRIRFHHRFKWSHPTNNHDVDDAEEIVIELSDGSEITVVDVKADFRSDVAVLKIDTPEELPFLPFGDDEQMEISDWVLAFGSRFGLHRSVTPGIIGAKGRGLSSSPLPQAIPADRCGNFCHSRNELEGRSAQMGRVNAACLGSTRLLAH
mgnify:CR=1 FL=1